MEHCGLCEEANFRGPEAVKLAPDVIAAEIAAIRGRFDADGDEDDDAWLREVGRTTVPNAICVRAHHVLVAPAQNCVGLDGHRGGGPLAWSERRLREGDTASRGAK